MIVQEKSIRSMKNRSKLAATLASLMLVASAFSQNITVKESDLPSEVLTKLKAQQKVEQVTQTLSAGKDWAEMGKAIGIATREGLSAVSDETAKFADTTPGRFTMAMIAWKVAGEDLKHFVRGVIVGIPFLIFWLSLYVWWLRKIYCQRKIKKVAFVGKDEERKEEVTFEYLRPLSLEYPNTWPSGEAWVPTVLPNIFFIGVAFIIVGWMIF